MSVSSLTRQRDSKLSERVFRLVPSRAQAEGWHAHTLRAGPGPWHPLHLWDGDSTPHAHSGRPIHQALCRGPRGDPGPPLWHRWLLKGTRGLGKGGWESGQSTRTAQTPCSKSKPKMTTFFFLSFFFGHAAQPVGS